MKKKERKPWTSREKTCAILVVVAILIAVIYVGNSKKAEAKSVTKSIENQSRFEVVTRPVPKDEAAVCRVEIPSLDELIVY